MFEKFVAHRGYQRAYPENTLLAFEQAIKAGALFLELDIQLSADKVALAFHDPELERMTGQPGSIHQTSWSELQALSAYEPKRFQDKFLGTKIMPLSDIAQLLQSHPEVTCYLEVKDQNAEYFSHDEILNAIKVAMGEQLQQCYLISFDTVIIQSAHQSGWQRLGWVLTNWEQVEEALEHAPYLEVIFSNEIFLREIEDVSDYPWQWVVYEIDQIEHARALWHKGVQQIETFAIKEMIEAIK